MLIFEEIQPLRDHLSKAKKTSAIVGFVPTMGALHDGHASLVKRAKGQCDVVVCSIFINPTQFNSEEDYNKYPVSIEADKALLESIGCDVLFCPSKEVIYTNVPGIKFSFPSLDDSMEGAYRPGHFSGVALVVSKLFNIVQPDKAYFGLKDLQQLRIIQQLVVDLAFPIDIIPVEIMRETGGLAQSSRNRRLSQHGQERASYINECLSNIEKDVLGGQSFMSIKNTYINGLTSEGFEVDYLELVDVKTLKPVMNKSENNSVAICVAAWLEGVRLIDNRIF